MTVAYIGIGSNSGKRLENCEFGVSRLFASGRSFLLGRSRIYETEPVGFTDQAWFLNLVVKIETDLEPEELLKELKDIETKAGRDFGRVRFGPRPLDLDILFYDNRVIDSHDLQIPHPRMHKRRFVLMPLCDLKADILHPVLKIKINRLLEELPENEQEVVFYKCDC